MHSMMRSKSLLVALALPIGAIFGASCSSGPLSSSKSDKDVAVNGPTILEAKTSPGTFELNRRMQAQTGAEVIAEVQDFQAPITKVSLRFVHVPLSVPMTHVRGSTWSAELTAQQLKMLAVNGQTIKYQANVVAESSDGRSASTQNPITVAIKSPDMNNTVG
jgi:hypothetical protein